MKNRSFVNVIGCGFAGCECALSLAEKGVKVHVFDDRDITHRPNEEAVEFASKKQFAEKLLKQELSFLGSNIIKIEKELASQEIYDSQILLEKARERVKNHPNIRFFNITVKELNFDEINVVATGPQTNKDFFEHLVQTFGSRKCFDCFPVFAMVENVQEKFFCHKGENLYLPLSYQEYIDFVNTIVLKLNFEILAQGKLPAKDTVEYMAMKKPVVCTRDLFECYGYNGVLIAENEQDFINKLDEAIELSSDDVIKNALYKAADSHSWNFGAERIMSCIGLKGSI